MGVDRGQRRLAPALLPGLAPAHDGTQHLVAIAEDVRRHVHRVGHGALDWPATAVDGRRRVRDPDAARRFGLGAGGHVHPSFPHATSTNQRYPTASHLAAGREAWRIGASVRRLARGGGPVVVAGAAARAAQSPGLPLQGVVGFRCVARVPGRSGRAGVGGRARRVPRAPRILDRRLGGLRRRHAGDQRPGPLRPRVVCTARVRARARRAPDRRRADLRRARQRRPRPPPRALPRRRRGRRPARRLHRQGPAVGQPDLRLGRAAQPALPLVGRAPAPHLPALRPRAHRPLPRLLRLLGGAGRRARRLGRALGARARARAVFDAALGRARRACR